jgi:uncharacterized Zn-binding protein involved in type VI secretion
MMRKILVVGDSPAPGGRVLPYDGPMLDLYGHRAALIGGRAYCEGCNSVGIIAKAGVSVPDGRPALQLAGSTSMKVESLPSCH